MNTSILRPATGLALAFILGATTAYAAKEKTHKLGDWEIGKVLFGAKLSKSELKGKVVVIENWGVNCPPCIAALPHLADLERKYRDKGLRIIGAESQGSTKDEIKPLIEKAKVEYTIVDAADGPLEVSAIPRAFVFDREGKLVFDGSPSGAPFEEAVTKAVGDSTGSTESSTAATPTAATTEMLIATRTWTNSDGREVKAAVKAVDDQAVTFVMENGKETKYPLEKLSEESRKTITEAGDQ
jgi:thiol-disulfide isomerase/thioredoxin